MWHHRSMQGVSHYENFPVASWLCPAHLRPAIAAIYHFARTADDLADEGTLTDGERLDAPQTVDAERLLAWRDGQLRVRDVPLQQVLEQLATYKGARLVLLNEAAGQRRVSGSFNLDQADSALDALLSSQKLRADALLGHWIIVR